MELVSTKTLQLFSGSGNRELAEEIATSLGVPLGHVELSTFANGEKYCRLGENVRGSDVFVVQGHCEPINDHVMEQLIMIDALKRASARRITAVCPFYGYSRQDRKAAGREPITARLLADLLTVAGTSRSSVVARWSARSGTAVRWSTGKSKKPWIWPVCRSSATRRSAPATVKRSASRRAVIGSRPVAFRSWRA